MTSAEGHGPGGRGRWLGLAFMASVATLGAAFLISREPLESSPPATEANRELQVRAVGDANPSDVNPKIPASTERGVPQSLTGDLATSNALTQQPPKSSAVKERPTVTKFLAASSPPGAADANPETVAAREKQWQQQIRTTTAAWVESGKLEAFMNSQEPQIGLTGDSVWFRDVCLVGQSLLEAVGLSADTAPAVCKETAFAQAALAIESVRKIQAEQSNAVADLLASNGHRQLRDSLLSGFDGLSQPSVLLDDAHLKQIARREVDKAYPKQPEAVRKRIAQSLAGDLINRAEGAWSAFSLYVRTIFFGNPDFGDREAFLVHEGFDGRQKAMEKKILEMISKNPKYKKAILDPGDVQGLVGSRKDRNVKALVRQHAGRLAETIRDVPTIKP